MPEKVRRLISILAAAASTACLIYLLVSGVPYFYRVSDLPEYVLTAKMLVSGKGSLVYTEQFVVNERKALFPQLRERKLGVISPPPALPLLIPLAIIPFDLLRAIWQPVLMLVTVVSFLILSSIFKLGLKQTAWFWAIWTLFAPFYEAVRIGQITGWLLLALTAAVALLWRGKDLPAGVLLASFVLKPQELVTFGLFLLGAGKYRVIVSAIVTVIILAVIAFWLMGFAGYENYFQLMHTLDAHNDTMQAELSPTVRGQLMRLGLPAGVTAIVSLSCLLIACAASFLWGRAQTKSSHWLHAGLIVTLPLGMLTAFLAHYYDLALLLPVAIVMIKSPVVHRFPAFLVVLALLSLAVFTLPVARIIHYEWLLTGLLPLNPFFLILFLAVGVIAGYSFAFRKDWNQPLTET